MSEANDHRRGAESLRKEKIRALRWRRTQRDGYRTASATAVEETSEYQTWEKDAARRAHLTQKSVEWAENGAKSLSHGADDGNWEIAKGVTSVIIATHQGSGRDGYVAQAPLPAGAETPNS